jgi:hypothetical protein
VATAPCPIAVELLPLTSAFCPTATELADTVFPVLADSPSTTVLEPLTLLELPIAVLLS